MLEKLKKIEGKELCNILNGPITTWLNGSVLEVRTTSIRYSFTVRKEMTDIQDFLSRGVMISMNEIGIQLILKTFGEAGQIKALSQRNFLPILLGNVVVIEQKVTAYNRDVMRISARVLNTNNTLASEIYTRIDLSSSLPE